MALFVSAESALLSNVHAAPGLALNPTFGPIGKEITFTITGFLTAAPGPDTTCSVFSPTNPAVVTFAGCVVSGGVGNGTFIVGNVPPGDYVIRVTGSPGGDFAEQVLTVTSGPSIQLIPSKGPTGTHVIVNGTGFLPSDTTCSIFSPTSGSILVNAACSIVPPIGSPPRPSNKTTGSFYVGSVPIGQYVIRVTGSPGGDYAEAVFNVTRGPQIILHPGKGPTGTHVQITGGFFVTSDTTCSISSPSSGAIIASSSAGCSVTAGSGLGAGFGNNVTGSFLVGNVVPGQYVIRVTGSPGGDFAEAVFNVTQGAFIQLFPSKGPTGTHVQIEGTNFLQSDTTCSISSVSGVIIGSGTAGCSVFIDTSGNFGGKFFGNQNVTGSFNVGNVVPGQYVIRVTGSPAGDFAEAIFNVTSGPRITMSPGSGRTGTHVSVNGTGFLSTDTSCSISSPTSGAFITFAACAISTSNGVESGSFIVGNVPPGQYVIQVTGSPGGDFGQIVFNVTRGPSISLSPGSGRIGIHVLVNGTGFLPVDTSCSISSISGGIITFAACAVNAGTGTPGGSFTVGNVPPGQYVIQISASPGGDYAQAVFNVTVGPRISMSPASGRIGVHVLVNGTGFLPTDNTCTISSPVSSIVTAAACSIQVGTGAPGGSFTVGNVQPGQYVIQVSGSPGADFAQAVFNVTIGPTITMSPASGRTGTHVLVNGTGFLPTDSTCSITSPGTGAVLSGSAACAIVFGSGRPSGSFTIGNVLPGQYLIQVTGSPGSDFGTMVFNVTVGPRITLSPATGRPGTHVSVNGTGFLPTDTACTVTSPGSSAVLPGTQACVIQAGTGVTSGSFTVGNILPGQYVIQVNGNQGDFAQALLNVTSGPSLTLSPATGSIGTHISVNGTGFLPTDVACTIVSGSSNSYNPILSGSQACVVTVGTGIVRGSFIVGNVPPGQYVVQVNGDKGDTAQAILNIIGGPATLSLFPTNATNGVTVTFRAYGLSASDTGCIVESVVETAPGIYTPNTILITSPSCSIVSPQTAQGTFVVGPYATTNINWTMQIRGTPVNDIPARAVFNVTASVNVTPPTGTINTVFTYTGTGFSSAASSCTATIIPPFPTGSNPGCYISAQIGQVSGSVVAPLNTPPGTYAVRVVDNRGKAATGVFTVGTPSALIVLNPATVAQGQPVGVAGTGFNPNDTYCVITAGTSAQLFASTPVCAISGGYVSGAFTVNNNAPGGYYLVTITGYFPGSTPGNLTRGDFASNFLGVNLASTITTFSTTTSTATTTTPLTTTTTSVATSYSFSSTTYSTTGILFTTYSQFTVNTVSGLTTTTISQTTSTSQTQTTVTVTTTTAFTTVSCGPLPCGFAVGSQGINPSPLPDSIGLLAVLLLILPMLLRRLLT